MRHAPFILCLLAAGCGDRTDPGGLEATSIADAATPSLDSSVAEDTATRDAPPLADVASPPAVCNPTLPPPEPGCYLPSGRPCLDGGCMCDDECNYCSCFDGGYGTTDIGCGVGATQPACAGPLTSECHRSTDPYDDLCGARNMVTTYCSGALVAACGAGVCPDTRCLFNHVDRENGGTYWCCP